MKGLRQQAVEAVKLGGVNSHQAYQRLVSSGKIMFEREFNSWLDEFDQWYFKDGKPRPKYGKMAVNKEDYFWSNKPT